MNRAGIWERDIPGQKNRRCKGPREGMCLMCLRIGRKRTPAKPKQSKEDDRK